MQQRIIIQSPFKLSANQKKHLEALALQKLQLQGTAHQIQFVHQISPRLGINFKIQYVFDSIKELDISLEEAIQKAILANQLDNLIEYLKSPRFKDIGFLIQLDSVVGYVVGLADIQYGELLRVEGQEVYAIALDLLEDKTGVIFLNETTHLKPGVKLIATGKQLSITVSEALLGRLIDPLGTPLDEKGPIIHTDQKRNMPLERQAPGVIEREPVNQPVQTGILAIDAIIPIGRGQRELIIGDRKTGKTTIAIDTILNQKDQDLICIYTAIGQKANTIAQIYHTLKEHRADKYTIIVSASASSPASLQYIAPYSATAIAEYFLEQGKDVLIIYDDLSKHAWAYRQISLLLRRPPGREAYPGDIFYLHSRLLERACKLNKERGGGSITALPIIQTEAGDVSAYIPTNVISITDGQIYLEPDLFNAGVRPAINVGLSVSRVGSNAQTKVMKTIAKKLRLDLAQFRELQSFAQFGGELDESTKQKLEHGKRLIELLKQPAGNPYSLAEEIVLLYAGVNGYLNELTIHQIQEWKSKVLSLLNIKHEQLAKSINTKRELTPEIEEGLKQLISESLISFRAQNNAE